MLVIASPALLWTSDVRRTSDVPNIDKFKFYFNKRAKLVLSFEFLFRLWSNYGLKIKRGSIYEKMNPYKRSFARLSNASS
jgi:hypothetical protein